MGSYGSKYFKNATPHRIRPISTKRRDKYASQAGIWAFTFLLICQIKKKIWHLNFVLSPQRRTGLEFQIAIPPTVFIHSQSNFMRTLAGMVEYRLLQLRTEVLSRKNIRVF